jgi:hypothetical protein
MERAGVAVNPYPRVLFRRYPYRIGAWSPEILKNLIGFPHFRYANYRITPRIGHDRSAPNNFQFIIQ